MLSAQESGDGAGHPPKQGHLDAADFSADFFLCIFCVTLEYRFFKCQNVEEQSAPQKSAHQESAQKSVSHIAENRFAHSGFPEDGSQKQKRNSKRICAKLAQNPSPKRPRERGGCEGVPSLPKTLQDLPAQSHHNGTPWPPPLSLGLGARERESERASAAEIPEPRP